MLRAQNCCSLTVFTMHTYHMSRYKERIAATSYAYIIDYMTVVRTYGETVVY